MQRLLLAAAAALALAGCETMDAWPKTERINSAEAVASDPLLWSARAHAGPGEFFLYGEESRELIRYKRPKEIQLCASREEGAFGDADLVPLDVTWDGTERARLFPGNCLYFEAQRVTVSPAAPLETGTVLRGTIDPR